MAVLSAGSAQLPSLSGAGVRACVRAGYLTDNLSLACAILDIEDEFLLLLFEFRAFAVEFPLSLLECPLMLAESLGRGLCPPKEGVLRSGRDV